MALFPARRTWAGRRPLGEQTSAALGCHVKYGQISPKHESHGNASVQRVVSDRASDRRVLGEGALVYSTLRAIGGSHKRCNACTTYAT